MKKLFALCLAAVVALGLAACGGSTSSSAAASEPGTSDAASSAAASVAAAGKDPANCKIGVIQLTEHVALDAARDGFADTAPAVRPEAARRSGARLSSDNEGAQE